MNEIKTDENLHIKGFFDNQTSTISYVVHDNIEKKCAVIDSVLDFDYSSGDIDYVNADKIHVEIGDYKDYVYVVVGVTSSWYEKNPVNVLKLE